MKIRLYSILIMLMFGAYVAQGQQQPLYTQFMFNKLALNPAFAGNNEFICLTAIHRNQWIGLEGSPSSQVISVNAPLKDQRLGIGLNLSRYSVGVTDVINIDGMYAYKIPMGPGVFSMGLQLSFRTFAIDFTDDRISTIDNIDIDPAVQQTKQSKQVYNVGTGFYYNTHNYYVGLSVPRLMNVDIDFDDQLSNSEEVQHIYLMGGGSVQIADNMKLTPQALFRWVGNAPIDFDLNMSLTVDEKYTGGLTYRAGGDSESVGESIDFLFSVQALPALTLGLAYDVSLSELRKYQSGSIELMAHYCIGQSDDASKFVNPRFY